jgi:hypothetical protein
LTYENTYFVHQSVIDNGEVSDFKEGSPQESIRVPLCAYVEEEVPIPDLDLKSGKAMSSIGGLGRVFETAWWSTPKNSKNYFLLTFDYFFIFY